MRNIDDFSLTEEEMIRLLEKRGYEFKKEKVSYWRSIYHNDSEWVEITVLVPYKNGVQLAFGDDYSVGGQAKVIGNIFRDECVKVLENLFEKF